MVYLQGHANFNEFWVTYISKLQSILFYFHNFGQLLTILCKLHSIFTKFNQFQLAFANFQPIFATSISFCKLFKTQYEKGG